MIAAAHCVHQKYHSTPLSHHNVDLIFGAYDLSNVSQPGTFSARPKVIIVHNEWNPNEENWDADIALFIMDCNVPTTKFIRPICLWKGTTEPDVDEGWVAGWGKSENTKDHDNTPKQLKIPVKDQEDCFLESPEFAKMSSRRTFCGGSRDGAGPCTGEIIF